MKEVERAGQLFLDGYNCSQAVFAAFCDRFGLTQETALKISAGLGGGVGRMREVCGAVSGAAMVLGSVVSATSGKDDERKAANYEFVREFAERFKARHNGTVICRELLEMSIPMEKSAMPEKRTPEYYENRPCLRLVENAAEILSQMIKEHEENVK